MLEKIAFVSFILITYLLAFWVGWRKGYHDGKNENIGDMCTRLYGEFFTEHIEDKYIEEEEELPETDEIGN